VSYETNAGRVLVSLSSLISHALVPLEDWILTISFLIRSCLIKSAETELHSTIHTICMATTSPSHVASLVEEGILNYWDRFLSSSGEGTGVDIRVMQQAISHLTSIDRQLRLLNEES
jgi:hypothetical protein